MKKFLETGKAFSMPQEAWYAEGSSVTLKNPYLMVGFYSKESGTK